jgi:anaerobic magnesium-protoporphyrin IX monomethyl ester cyclase
MKVCLINPYVDISETIYRENFTMLCPLGLGYLSAALAERGHEVAIVDCISASPMPAEKRDGGMVRLGHGNAEIMRRVNAFGPDIVGISCCYTEHAPQCYEIAGMVKKDYSEDVPVIVGGAHPSVRPDEVLDNPSIDFVAIGEGEGIITDLCDAIVSGSTTDDILGLLRSDGNGALIGNPVRPRITDLDGIPFPRRDLFPLENYFKRQRLFPHDINNRNIPKTSILTSRGCPGNCVFCAIRCTWGRKWIGRSPENVVEEIESLVSEYGIRELDFVDDSVSVSRSRLKRICELMIQKGIDIKWTTPNGIAIWTLDRELLSLMKRAGCYRLVFGFESGDPETLAFIRKKYSRKQVKDIVRHANRLGMWTVGTFIVGFPYESGSHIQNTMDFASSLGLDLAMFYCAMPYPGTDLYDICTKEGIDTTIRPHKRGFATLCLTADEVDRYREVATVQFMRSLMRRPWKPLEKIRNIDDLRYTLRVVTYGMRMLFGRSEAGKLNRYPNFRR